MLAGHGYDQMQVENLYSCICTNNRAHVKAHNSTVYIFSVPLYMSHKQLKMISSSKSRLRNYNIGTIY